MNIKTLWFVVAGNAQKLAQSIAGSNSRPASRPVGGEPSSRMPAANVTPNDPVCASVARPRRQKQNQARGEVEPIPLEQRRWLTIKETSARFPCFSQGALRHLIYSAEAYAKYPKAGLRSDGFLACIVRPAGQRKVLIDAEKFEAWLASSASPHGAGRATGANNIATVRRAS